MNLNHTRFNQTQKSLAPRRQEGLISGKRRRSDKEEVLGVQDFLALKEMERKTNGESFFAASASSGTSKLSGASEDRFQVARLPRTRVVTKPGHSFKNSFFAAVFDGHGGSQTSQFAKEHLMKEFFDRYEKSNCDSQIPELLKQSYVAVDAKLYQNLLEVRSHTVKKKETDCNCKFFLENPCRCLEATREARTGSTATSVVLKNNVLYVANIGDSEACLFSYHKVKEQNRQTSTELINRSTSSEMFKELTLLKTREEKEGENNRVEILKAKLLKSFVDLFSMEKEMNSSGPDIIDLTRKHTPTCNNHQDYARIASIAIKRQIELAAEGKNFDFGDGIKKGTDERYNYVRFPGAHSLNMTRAFGNFGHKVYKSSEKEHEIDELNSPVLPIPFISYFDLAECQNDCFLVIASDGLWDNVSKREVYEYVMTYVKTNIVQVCKLVEATAKYKAAATKVRAEVVLGVLASNVARGLTKKATCSKRKLDDVTVVVVLFNSILSAFL